MSSPPGKHAATASQGPAVPEPTFAERTRTQLYLERVGTLSTVSRKQPGFPFGSVMPYVVDPRGRPVFLISSMAMHTQNLQADPRSSLLVTDFQPNEDPLGASRVTLVGNTQRVAESDRTAARELYLARHSNSKYWVDFEDFDFYQMDVVDLYYVGGFGVMGWVEASQYGQSQPDPLSDSAAEIIRHMNDDHGDALLLLAKAFAGIEAQEAKMTAVDRLGFNVRLKTPERMRGARIAFLREVANPQQTREVLVQMVQQAREG
jgi:putative heme iron utilization protein